MRTIRIPRFLHEVLGEEQGALEIALVGLGGLTAAAAFAALAPTGTSSAVARLVAIILAADLGAGAIANFTRGTSDYYALRPRLRWVFIAIHLHLLAMALLIGVDLGSSAIVWAYTIAAASAVNLSSPPRQIALAGAFVAVGTVLVGTLAWESPALRLAAALFLVKVAYAFAVDHYAAGRGRSVGAGA